MGQFVLTDPAGFQNTVFDGDFLYKAGNKILNRQVPATVWRKNEVVTRSNSVLQDVAIFFRFMTSGQKDAWKGYKQWYGAFRSYYNCFVKNNMQIQYPFFDDIEKVMDITSPPQIPNKPHDFTAGYCINVDAVLLEWQYEGTGDTYIGAGFKRLYSGVLPTLDKIRILGGDLAELEFYEVPNSMLSYSSKLLFSIRYCNFRGEVSPWCDPIIVDMPDAPSVDFTAFPLSGSSPLEVDFQDATVGEEYKYLWQFGDGATSEEHWPTHIYEGPESSFDVKLTVWGVANSKRSRSKKSFITILNTEIWDTIIFICDPVNSRIEKRLLSNFSYLNEIGSYGSGDDQFINPSNVIADNTYIYVNDSQNSRIVKRLKSNLSFIDQRGSHGSGDDQFDTAIGITCDLDYLYIVDYGNNRIQKRSKTDLSLIAMFTSPPINPGTWQDPFDITVDDTNIYFTTIYNWAMYVFNKSTFAFIRKYRTPDYGDPYYTMPKTLFVDTAFIWLVVSYNYLIRIDKISKFDFSWLMSYETGWTAYGEATYGITSDATYIYVSNIGQSQIVKIKRVNMELIDTFGNNPPGSGEFHHPRGLSVASPFTVFLP